MYPQYKFNMILIIVGALGYILKGLTSYMQDLSFDKNESKVIILWKCKILLLAMQWKFAKYFSGLNNMTWQP